MAGGLMLGFGLMMESNYPPLLSRTVAEKSQYGPGLLAYMVLGVKYWQVSLVVNLSDYPGASAEEREGDRCCLVA